MVSLFCECCSQLKDFTFFIERVYFLSASTSNLNSSIGEEYNKDEAFFDCVFRGGSYLRDQYVSAPFNLGFYFSAYADYSIERAKTPLYMNYLDNGDFEYKIGSDFITPLGKEKINNRFLYHYLTCLWLLKFLLLFLKSYSFQMMIGAIIFISLFPSFLILQNILLYFLLLIFLVILRLALFLFLILGLVLLILIILVFILKLLIFFLFYLIW